jgi:mannobiose 2-epimerase
MTQWTDEQFIASVREELWDNLLPFWRSRTVDGRWGGFIGQMSNDLRVQDDAPKGLILNARILWSFSAFYRHTQDERDRAVAKRAYEYLIEHFQDPQHGGYFWELDPAGNVLDDKKKIYGQAFCIYALAEYSRACNEPVALKQASEVFALIESYASDRRYGGYLEVLSRHWQPCEDMRLSDKDLNEKKSMNNHLHVLEGYTNLVRVSPEPPFVERLRDLVEVFRQHIVDSSHTHFRHFFDEAWTPKSDRYTFGHDIEGSWLLCEAVETLGSPRLLKEVQALAVKMARAVLEEGLDQDGGLLYEGSGGQVTNPNKEWWPQAEAVVGFYNAWQLTGDAAFREAAVRCWRFIKERVADAEHGEWFWCVRPDGTPDPTQPKVSAWKGPYHNGRCCLEMIRRLSPVARPSTGNTSHEGPATSDDTQESEE